MKSSAELAGQPKIHAYDFIDLPPIKPIVLEARLRHDTRINLHSGICPCCGKVVTATPPLDMPPGSPFGPGITALVVYLHTQQFVSYNRMAEMLKGVFGLDISQGAIANMLARAGKPFARQAKGIAEVVRNSAVISSDETSARVQGKTWWQWVFGSAQTFGPSGPGAVSHRIADTRGAIAVTEALAGARPEVWVSDRYSAQRGHGVLHQACLAHLLRDALGLLPPRQAATAMYAIDSGDWWFALAFKAARP